MPENKKPIIFQQGAPKSASSFCAQLLREIAAQNGGRQSEAEKILGGHSKGGFVDNLGSCKEKLQLLPELSVVKTHLRPYSAEGMLERGEAVAFVTFRDPLDSVQSLLDHADAARETGKQEFTYVKSVTQAAKIIQWHISHSIIWLRNSNAYPVFYEDLKNDPLGTATFMAKKTGVSVDEERIKDLFKDKSQIRRFNIGKAGRGRALLDTAEGAEAARIFSVFYHHEKWIQS
jgi:hypothetical protein